MKSKFEKDFVQLYGILESKKSRLAWRFFSAVANELFSWPISVELAIFDCDNSSRAAVVRDWLASSSLLVSVAWCSKSLSASRWSFSVVWASDFTFSDSFSKLWMTPLRSSSRTAFNSFSFLDAANSTYKRKTKACGGSLIDRSIDWSINWLLAWLIDRSIDWLIDWSINGLVD